MPIELLENVVNDVSDQDSAWWPFLWIRPDRHARLSLARLGAMALLYGAPMGALLGFSLALVRPALWASIPASVLGFTLLFFAFTALVVRPMWNRRADRLRSRNR